MSSQCQNCPFLIEASATDPVKGDKPSSAWCILGDWYWEQMKIGMECKVGEWISKLYSVS